MHVKRHHVRTDDLPYELTFEFDGTTNFHEQFVAKNAVMLSPFDQRQLGTDSATATEWAAFGFSIVRKQGNNGDFQSSSVRLTTDRLRYFGGLLAYYAENTESDMWRIMQNNPPSKEVFGSRRVEGKMAAQMHDTITDHINVPKLWTPAAMNPIGFGATAPREQSHQ